MIDFVNLPNYRFTDEQLEEFLIFAICVANKSAATIAPRVDRFCNLYEGSPLGGLVNVSRRRIQSMLRRQGVGCHELKSHGIKAASSALQKGLSLRTCTPEELESLPAIGPKTSRFFILHSRPGARHAVLDTHLLKFLREAGHDVPSTTPKSGSRYDALERVVLRYADLARMTAAEFDIKKWKSYAL